MPSEKIDITAQAAKLAADGTPAPQVGEILHEYNKVFEKMMKDIIFKHRKYANVYFIDVLSQKDPFNVNVIHRRYVVRKSCPDPQWNSEVYSYNNLADQLKLEWVLPTAQDAMSIMKHAESYDPALISCINKQRKGELRIPAYSP